MRRKKKYPLVTVKVPQHKDPNCRGSECCRKPGESFMAFTCSPERVEKTPAIARLIALGSLVETDEEPVLDDPKRRPAVGRDLTKDFAENVLNR